MYKKSCIICLKSFDAKINNKKTCSQVCFVKHRRNRVKQNKINNSTKHICKGCGQIYKRHKKRNGFCTRTCASKYYYNNGFYNTWHKNGINLNLKKTKPHVKMKCRICDEQYYIKEKEAKRNRSKTCSVNCRAKYAGEFVKILNNFNCDSFKKRARKIHGKNTYDYSLIEKIINIKTEIPIVCKKHNIFWQQPMVHLNDSGCPKCAYLGFSSKGQKQVYELLKKYNSNKYKIILEHEIKTNNNSFKVDICYPEKKFIVEYYGDYWHCNPKKYNADYWHEKIGKKAKEIWKHDNQRKQKLEKLGYKIIQIWESDFKLNQENTIQKILDEVKLL